MNMPLILFLHHNQTHDEYFDLAWCKTIGQTNLLKNGFNIIHITCVSFKFLDCGHSIICLAAIHHFAGAMHLLCSVKMKENTLDKALCWLPSLLFELKHNCKWIINLTDYVIIISSIALDNCLVIACQQMLACHYSTRWDDFAIVIKVTCILRVGIKSVAFGKSQFFAAAAWFTIEKSFIFKWQYDGGYCWFLT